MTKPKTDRRRKRRSPSSEEAPSSWAVLPLIVLVGFTLSVAISFCSDEAQHFDDGFIQNPVNIQHQQQQQQQQRRFLLTEEERVLDVGIEENIWHSQLRARKNQGREQQRKNDHNNNRRQMTSMTLDSEMEDGRPMKRMAIIPRYTDKHHFEECVGQTIEECQILIDEFVTANPDDFKNQTTLNMDIRKIRELTDDSYYKVVIRTNTAGDQSYGIFDDGVIYYPWKWRVGGQDREIGPWDCEAGGDYMSPEACCAMIQEDVMVPDDLGNFMACFVEEPVGGPNNPEREDRAIVVTNDKGRVMRAPVAH